MGRHAVYSLEFRERAIRRMKLGDNVSKLARELGVDRMTLYQWKRKLDRQPHSHRKKLALDWRDDRIAELEAKITRLEGIIGGQWLDLDFLESALRRVERMERKKGGDGGKASTPKSVAGHKRKAG